jgi:hypothetical protein
MPSVDTLRGLWRRTLLERPDEPPDVSSTVLWLQGPRFFVDLRLPVGRPDFTTISCLRHLQAPQLKWLAGQQGFAGRLRLDGDLAWWRRGIDFQPRTDIADRARLQLSGEILEERGTEACYLERWEREAGPLEPAFGLKLAGTNRRDKGYLVRVGNHFMYARARRQPLPAAASLLALLDSTLDLTAKQDLLDFEISFGRIDHDTGVWRIERSSLPFREGTVIAPTPQAQLDRFSINDMHGSGETFARPWIVVERDTLGLEQPDVIRAVAQPNPAPAASRRVGRSANERDAP